MNNGIVVAVLVTGAMAIVVICTACGSAEGEDMQDARPLAETQPARVEFVAAEVKTSPNADHGLEAMELRLTEPADVAELAAFFAEAGQGRTGPLGPVGRIAGTLVRLQRGDGTELTITVDSRYELWSEGRADWPLDERFVPWLRSMQQRERGRQAEREPRSRSVG